MENLESFKYRSVRHMSGSGREEAEVVPHYLQTMATCKVAFSRGEMRYMAITQTTRDILKAPSVYAEVIVLFVELLYTMCF